MAAGTLRLRAMAHHAALLTRRRSLPEVLDELGFVQYDPIRRPARAQDLILHQRVRGYRCGDLDRGYAESGLEEDYFYTYGALTKPVRRLLHPRNRTTDPYTPEGLAEKVLHLVRREGRLPIRAVEQHFGRIQAVNDWGGISSATTRELERLHYHGLLRVADRRNGSKVYAPGGLDDDHVEEPLRSRQLVLRIARILAPTSRTGLRAALTQLAGNGGVRIPSSEVDALVADGSLATETVDGVPYLWPADCLPGPVDDVPRSVRFLAPFDPLVWDRGRFEHLWGWPYRFEAYTPAAKRRFGYYALPMFWGDRAVGWANCEITGSGRLDVHCGFAGRALAGKRFQASFDHEVSRLARMLGLPG